MRPDHYEGCPVLAGEHPTRCTCDARDLTQRRVVLSDMTMIAVREMCDSEAPAPVMLHGVLLMILGACWLDTQEKPVSPTMYAIPEEQWTRVGEMLSLGQRKNSGHTQANILLDWMNLGPSGYKEED